MASPRLGLVEKDETLNFHVVSIYTANSHVQGLVCKASGSVGRDWCRFAMAWHRFGRAHALSDLPCLTCPLIHHLEFQTLTAWDIDTYRTFPAYIIILYMCLCNDIKTTIVLFQEWE